MGRAGGRAGRVYRGVPPSQGACPILAFYLGPLSKAQVKVCACVAAQVYRQAPFCYAYGRYLGGWVGGAPCRYCLDLLLWCHCPKVIRGLEGSLLCGFSCSSHLVIPFWLYSVAGIGPCYAPNYIGMRYPVKPLAHFYLTYFKGVCYLGAKAF